MSVEERVFRAVVVTLCAFALSHGRTATALEWNERIIKLIEDHESVWKRVRSLNQNVDRTIKFDRMSRNTPRSGTAHLKLQPNGRVVVQDDVRQGVSLQTAVGQNNQYSFTLSRKDRDAKWVLEDVVIQKDEYSARNYALQLGGPFNTHTCVCQTPLEEFFRDSGIVVVDMTEDSKSNAIQIRFTNKLPRKEPEAFTFTSGTISLDTSRDCCISQLHFERTDGARTWVRKYKVEYDPIASVAAKLPISKSFDYQLILQEPGKPEFLDIQSHSEFETRFPSPPIPLRDFTLTAFGLPEPSGTTVLSQSVPFWLLGTIAGVFLIGAGIYFRRRRAV